MKKKETENEEEKERNIHTERVRERGIDTTGTNLFLNVTFTL